MSEKIQASFEQLKLSTPVLFEALTRHPLALNEQSFQPFEYGGVVITYNPFLIDDLSQDDVTFGLAILGWMISNDLFDSDQGRNALAWAQATNMAAHAAVEKVVPATARAGRLVERFASRYPTLAWRNLSVDDLYAGIVLANRSVH